MAWETLDQQLNNLSPVEIGARLWTTYRTLDDTILEKKIEGGTTASTTVYDGKGNLITATLADAASFAAVYGQNGELLGVVRLNSVTHKPADEKERERIEAAGGNISNGRVDGGENGRLAVSRAIGDAPFKESGVCSEATIDVTSIDELSKRLNVERKKIGTVQIITTCDGFTDATFFQTQEAHEELLSRALTQLLQHNKNPSEKDIAEALVHEAKQKHSKDNITVAIQTIPTISRETPAFMLGVYDGHGGAEVATFVAKNIGSEFKKQCSLTPIAYQEQPLSAQNHAEAYERDNPNHLERITLKNLQDLTSTYLKNLNNKSPQYTIVTELNGLLNDDKLPKNQRIAQFYNHLENKADSNKTNIDIIKADKSINGRDFLKGVAIVFAIILTGVLPGVLVLLKTKTNLSDYFNTQGNKFINATNQFKNKCNELKGKGESKEPDQSNDTTPQPK